MVSTDGTNVLEKANVSDGPPVEHSIMKRAWPYALALAVVVTGCYLALTPLLRSLSPAPTTSSSPLSQNTSVVTVGKAKFNYTSQANGSQGFVSALQGKKKAAKKKAKKVASRHHEHADAVDHRQHRVRGHLHVVLVHAACFDLELDAHRRRRRRRPRPRKHTGSVGGVIDQSHSDNGFAGHTGSGSVKGGVTLSPGS